MSEFDLKRFHTWKALVEDTVASLSEDVIPQLAAAMAFWLLVTLSAVAFVLSRVATWLLSDASPLPPQTLGALREPAENAADIAGGSLAFAGSLAPVIATVLVLVGASAVFGQFVYAIDRIWKLPPRRGATYQFIRKNLLAFLLLAVFGIAIIVALVMAVVASRVVDWAAARIISAGGLVPQFESTTLLSWLSGTLAAWGLFVMAFWIVPGRSIRFRDVVPGAALTAIAYQIGVTALSLWLPSTTKFEIYGVFGFFISAIVFIYYVALIALVGAEFTRHWVLRAEAGRGDVVPTDAT